MLGYSSYELVAVDAIVIPAGSVIPDSDLRMDALIFHDNNEVVPVYDDFADEDPDSFEVFEQPKNWVFNYMSHNEKFVTVKRDCTILEVSAFGDGVGSVSSGIDFEINNGSLFDAFSADEKDSAFKLWSDLARRNLAKYKSSPGYKYGRRKYDYPDEAVIPLDVEDQEIHLVLVYKYTSHVDDYNQECDVYIEYQGQLDMKALKNAILDGANGAQ